VKAIECSREIELVDAIAGGLWPDRAEKDLHDHAQTCEACRDVLAVVEALRQEQAHACRQAPVPFARVVWWRARVRARAEAAQTVTQPITWLNGITTVSVIAVSVATMSAASRLFETRGLDLNLLWGWANRLFDFSAPTRSPATGIATVSLMVVESSVLGWGLAACLLLAPVALYWIFSDD
jgi:hypothetical protein